MKKRIETFTNLHLSYELRWIDRGHFVIYKKPKIVIEAVNNIISSKYE